MRKATAIAAAVAVLAVAAPVDAAVVDPTPFCGSGRTSPFADTAGVAQRADIACLAASGVAGGTSATTYSPAAAVTRGQMATFLARFVGEARELATGALPALPASPPDAFTDEEGSVHEPAIDALAAAGIVRGTGGRSFSPGRPVTRSQLATFVAATVAFLEGAPLPAAAADPFDDDDGGTHEANIGRLERAGIVAGTGPRRYEPEALVTRAQLASFVVRSFALLLAHGRIRALPPPPAGSGPCPMFPADSFWHADIRGLAVHPRSAAWRASIGTTRGIHADFGSGTWDGGPIGIPFVVVPASQPSVPVTFEYDDESDAGPYPIPANAPIEGGAASDGDRHVLVVQEGTCTLSELYAARPQANGSWTAGSGAVWDLRSNALRPAGWTSADAAGLAILPGLVRYDEVAAGIVDHAIRFTAPRTQDTYLWPARHQAGRAGADLPPMGTWMRLRSTIDPNTFPAQVRPIVVAMQTHGLLLADNGSSMYISGAPDERWDNDQLRTLSRITAADFEVVDAAPLRVSADSGAVRS